MALTSSIKSSAVPGATRVTRAVITGDTSYPTGGYTLTPALFGYTTLTGAVAHSLVGIPTNAAQFSFNPATLKLQFLTTAGVEVAAAVNVSTVSVLISGEGA